MITGESERARLCVRGSLAASLRLYLLRRHLVSVNPGSFHCAGDGRQRIREGGRASWDEDNSQWTEMAWFPAWRDPIARPLA